MARYWDCGVAAVLMDGLQSGSSQKEICDLGGERASCNAVGPCVPRPQCRGPQRASRRRRVLLAVKSRLRNGRLRPSFASVEAPRREAPGVPPPGPPRRAT